MTQHPDVQPTMHGIRGHRIRTAAEAETERRLIERYDREHPIDLAVILAAIDDGPTEGERV